MALGTGGRSPAYLINLLWRSLRLGGLGARLAATDASSRIEIPGGVSSNNMIMVSNLGAQNAFVIMGPSDCVATTSGFPILAGQQVYLPIQPQGVSVTHIAGICEAGLSTTLLVTSGIAAFQ